MRVMDLQEAISQESTKEGQAEELGEVRAKAAVEKKKADLAVKEKMAQLLQQQVATAEAAERARVKAKAEAAAKARRASKATKPKTPKPEFAEAMAAQRVLDLTAD